MSDAPYEKECLYCHNKIRMSKESGKWLPYNLNNGQHDCRKQEPKQEPPKQEQPKNNEAKLGHVVELIHQVLKELEDLKKQ